MTHLPPFHPGRVMAHRRRSSLIRATLLTLASVSLLLLGGVAAGSEEASEAQVAEARGVAEALMSSMRETARDADLTVSQRRELLASTMSQNLDFLALSRRALGPLVERFSEEERTDFAVAYSRHMSVNFIRSFELDGDTPTVVTEARPLKNGDVEVRLQGPEGAIGAPLAPQRTRGPVTSQLRLRKRGDRYRVTQIVIGGVDVSQTFRAQAQSVLDQGSPADLIADLEGRTQKFIDATIAADEQGQG